MSPLLDTPLSLFAVTLISLWLIAFVGFFGQKIWRPLRREEQQEFTAVQGATLTLLALIVGFTFSMSVSRYDQRKNLEESEANAIGTEFVRAQLLPPASRTALEKALRAYLDRRIAYLFRQGAVRNRAARAGRGKTPGRHLGDRSRRGGGPADARHGFGRRRGQ